MRGHLLTVLGVAALLGAALTGAAQRPEPVGLARFVDAASTDERTAAAALQDIARHWRDGWAAIFVDQARMLRPPAAAVDAAAGVDDAATGSGRPTSGLPTLPDRGSPVRRRLLAFLEKQTGKRFGDDLTAWRRWVWTLPYEPHAEYAGLKAIVYGQVDARMRDFFPPGVKSLIRLDEIDWGGVTVNGIPPLRQPTVVAADEARYLNDSNVVFGVVVNGQARAYPKRILAWHEMAIDRVGGVDLTLVYCTLCGTVIPYESATGGRLHRFGTSGLLYQSNKLMFDEDTRSLWSTLEGRPVVGTLVDAGLALRLRPVVTTTWKDWRTSHPSTTVLSLDTGYRRDYSEGAAYRDYFATDRLMFQVSRTDGRLPNKAEVLVMRLPAGNEDGPPSPAAPVAIDTRFLQAHPVFAFEAGGRRYTVITSAGGANRVYRTDVDFPAQAAGTRLRDASGRLWQVTDAAIIAEDGGGAATGPRVPAHRSFWFGWYAQFPSTTLIK